MEEEILRVVESLGVKKFVRLELSSFSDVKKFLTLVGSLGRRVVVVVPSKREELALEIKNELALNGVEPFVFMSSSLGENEVIAGI